MLNDIIELTKSLNFLISSVIRRNGFYQTKILYPLININQLTKNLQFIIQLHI
jgi:hypothetical protein